MPARRRLTNSRVLRRLLGVPVAEGGLRIVPFVPGWRPTHEATHAGLGSSDQAALILGRPPSENAAYVLFSAPAGAPVDVTLSVGAETVWDRRPLPLRCFDEDGSLRPARPDDTTYVLAIAPETDLAGGEFGFEHLFLETVRVELRTPDAVARTTLEACDVRRPGSLYVQILERLVVPDAERQAEAAGVQSPGVAYHPWFPVLLIGYDKAALYTRALVADIVDKQRHLADPAWLMRLGVHLELLTCLGIAEAVRGEVEDVLTSEQRAAFEGERFAAIRERVDPAAWREVWALRDIAFPRRGVPRAGPVSILNLLNKKRATLKFLHAHHEDLKRAIELAGPNRLSAQETWQRVFRDAERAVLGQTPLAFPELGYLPSSARDLVLWHRRGRLGVLPLRVPKAISALMADQDGLFPAASNQYRASMNAVAAWAKDQGLMNIAGRECVPRRVSLVEACMETPERVAALQRRDGYGERLDVADAPDATEPPAGDAEELLASVPILRLLGRDELLALARSARPLALGPTERFVVQDTEGTSLFVVADGEVEVVLSRSHGPDLLVDTMGRGAVVGEMSLLTGEPRSATVRAVDSALVYEIGPRQFEPLLRAHPEWIEALAEIMERRLREREASLDAYDARARREEIGGRILQRFFGGAPGAARTAE